MKFEDGQPIWERVVMSLRARTDLRVDCQASYEVMMQTNDLKLLRFANNEAKLLAMASISYDT